MKAIASAIGDIIDNFGPPTFLMPLRNTTSSSVNNRSEISRPPNALIFHTGIAADIVAISATYEDLYSLQKEVNCGH